MIYLGGESVDERDALEFVQRTKSSVAGVVVDDDGFVTIGLTLKSNVDELQKMYQEVMMDLATLDTREVSDAA